MNADFAVANQYLAASRPDLAERHLRLVLAAEPDDALAHAFLAECLAARHAVDEATTEARESIRLAPDRCDGYAALASAQGEAHRWRAAEQTNKQALRIDPNDPRHWSQLAYSLVQQGRTRRAIEAADRGLRINPTDVGCLNGRALALLDAGQVAAARETIRSALVSAPVSATLHANLAYLLLVQGETPAARAEALEALRLDPGLRMAQHILRAGERDTRRSRRLWIRTVSWWLHQPVWERNLFVVGIAAAGVLSPVAWLLALMIGLSWVAVAIPQFIFPRTTRLDNAPRGLLAPVSGLAALAIGLRLVGGSIAGSLKRRSVSAHDLASAAACLPVAALIVVAFIVGARPVEGYQLPSAAALVAFALLALAVASARPIRQVLFVLALVVIAVGTWDAVFVGPTTYSGVGPALSDRVPVKEFG